MISYNFKILHMSIYSLTKSCLTPCRYLHSNNLATLPDAIGELSSLTRLNLDHNQLSSLNSCIGNLSNLKYLNISGNRLTALPKGMYCNNIHTYVCVSMCLC